MRAAREAVPLRFDNRLLRLLPVDRRADATVSRTVQDACISLARPTPLLRPKLVAASPSALALVGLHVPSCSVVTDWPADMQAAYASVFSGNVLLEESEPYAHNYCGHQFGSFAGQLGDGAAICLGEALAPGSSVDARRYEVQLKGAGPTPYSRGMDGRKVLRSSIREFLCSEYMHGLGIPTTRAAVLTTSDNTVARDPLYNGKIRHEACAVVTRIAPTFLRFGSFQLCHPGDGSGSGSSRRGPSCDNLLVLEKLIRTTCELYFREAEQVAKVSRGAASAAGREDSVSAIPTVSSGNSTSGRSGGGSVFDGATAAEAFRILCDRTASLVAAWQAVGFVHGVLNTDNMSILGLTLDYGPFAFMSYFDRDFVANLSDESGRYSYSRQPGVCGWNLLQLAEAFALVHPEMRDTLRAHVHDVYVLLVGQRTTELMLRKLGLEGLNVTLGAAFVEKFLSLMAESRALFHKTFWLLEEHFPFTPTYFSASDRAAGRLKDRAAEVAHAIESRCCPPTALLRKQLQSRLQKLAPQVPKRQLDDLLKLLEAAEAERQDTTGEASTSEGPVTSQLRMMLNGAPLAAVRVFLEDQQDRWRQYGELVNEMKTLEALLGDASPSSEDQKSGGSVKPEASRWTSLLEEYYGLQASLVSTPCDAAARKASMMRANPRFVLFPWILDAAVKAAEQGDFSLVQQLAQRVTTPYEHDDRDGVLWSCDVPEDPSVFLCSCSS